MLQRQESATAVAGGPAARPQAPARRVKAPRELGPTTQRQGVIDPTPAELTQLYRVVASAPVLNVLPLEIYSGGIRVKGIFPGRDDSYAANGGTNGRLISLTAEGRPRTELSLPSSLRGFDGQPVSGRLLNLCTIVSRLPRNVVVEMAVWRRDNPLGELWAMEDSLLDRVTKALAQLGGGRGIARQLDSFPKWNAFLVEQREIHAHQPSVLERPWFSLAGWDGANGYEAVRILGPEGREWLKGGQWLPARTPPVAGGAEAVVRILEKIPTDVVVDLHETFGSEDAIRQVRVMGPEKAVAFALFLEKQFEAVKTLMTWERSLRNFEAFWGQGQCFAHGCDDSDRSSWVGRTVQQLYKGGHRQGASLEEWVQQRKREIAQFSNAGITAADVASYAASGAVLKDTRVEKVELVSGTLRVILREPIFARVIAQGGRTYRETTVGMYMRQYPIVAFDMHFNGETFPTATAYADKECRRHAKHSNIRGGRVCMGELGYRDQSRGATLNDFLRMLVVWNLDSPHHSGEDYLMQQVTVHPSGTPMDGHWVRRARGMEEIQMGFAPHPELGGPGIGVGTVEVVEEEDLVDDALVDDVEENNEDGDE